MGIASVGEQFAKETEEGATELFESQEYLIKYAQQMRLAAAENEVARQAEERRLAIEAKDHAQAEREAAMEAASKVAASLAVASAVDEKAGAPADSGDEDTFTHAPVSPSRLPTTAPSLAGTKPQEKTVNEEVDTTATIHVAQPTKKSPKLLVKILSLFVKK